MTWLSAAERWRLWSADPTCPEEHLVSDRGSKHGAGPRWALVRATSLRLTSLAVGRDAAIQDSLQAGRLRFYVEITRVRKWSRSLGTNSAALPV